jgi:hypothetical protein
VEALEQSLLQIVRFGRLLKDAGAEVVRAPRTLLGTEALARAVVMAHAEIQPSNAASIVIKRRMLSVGRELHTLLRAAYESGVGEGES